MSDLARLRWRCRRGMRELDQLLGWYLEQRYAGVDDATKAAFSTLLDQQDPQLWSWLSGRGTPERTSSCLTRMSRKTEGEPCDAHSLIASSNVDLPALLRPTIKLTRPTRST